MNTKKLIRSIDSDKPLIEQIKDLVNDGGKYTSAVIHAIVSQKLSVKGNPLYEGVPVAQRPIITKEVIYQCSLNGNYTNAVNNQLERENKERNFTAKENWFTKAFDFFNGTIVKHNEKPDEFYLLIRCNYSKTIQYFVNGQEADPIQEKIIKEFKISSLPKNQGTDEPIIMRTIAINNIHQITCGDQLILK